MDVQYAYQDLIWAAQSSSLIRNDLTTSLLDATDLERLHSEATFQSFRGFLLRRQGSLNHKVGLYFELLVEFLISNVLEAHITHRNHQVVENGRTLGEIDFIFEHRGAIWHLEAASKFYLASPEPHPKGSHLVGPNADDSFETKIDRMLRHQLPLSRRVCPEVTHRVAYVKGRIFYPVKPPGMVSMITRTCSKLHRTHDRGVWCRAADFSDVVDSMNSDRYLVRTKPHWLSSVRQPEHSIDGFTALKTKAHLVQHFANSHRPLMLSALVEEDGWLEEVERVFVVEDSWPGRN